MSILGRDPEISKLSGNLAYAIALGLAIVNIRYSVNYFQFGQSLPPLFSLKWASSWLPALAMSSYEAAFAAVLTTPQMHEPLLSIPNRIRMYHRGTRQKIYLWAVWGLVTFMVVGLFICYRYDYLSTYGGLLQANYNLDAVPMMAFIFVFGSEVLIVAGNASKWAGLIGEAATVRFKQDLLNEIRDAKGQSHETETAQYNGSAHAPAAQPNTTKRTPNR